MRRSVWLWPSSGLPWWSALMSWILAPPRFERPPLPTDGSAESSGCMVLTSSTPRAIASSSDLPALGAFPESGKARPAFAGAGARRGAGGRRGHEQRGAETMTDFHEPPPTSLLSRRRSGRRARAEFNAAFSEPSWPKFVRPSTRSLRSLAQDEGIVVGRPLCPSSL